MQAQGKSETIATGLLGAYQNVRAYTEKLCEPLEVEDYIPQPIVDVSPAKWNIAHTTWFFEEMILKQFVPGYKVFDERFGFLFNSYYNTIGERTPRDNRGALSRPTVSEVFAFRKYVDDQMAELLSTTVSPEIVELVTLGLNHEQQHQELFLTDLKYTLSINPLFPAYREGFAPEELSEPPAVAGGLAADGINAASLLDLQPPDTAGGSDSLVELSKGVYEIGFKSDGFCFDNELARHKVYLQDFAISDRLVTNAEFVEFIDAGGYTDFRFWHSEGWDWVNREGINAPLYWNRIEGEWNHFTLGGSRQIAAGGAGLSCFVLRSVSVCRMEGYAFTDGVRMGSRE
ncbi:MAG: DinB family protein [Pyrinomonadaceae bacterium]